MKLPYWKYAALLLCCYTLVMSLIKITVYLAVTGKEYLLISILWSCDTSSKDKTDARISDIYLEEVRGRALKSYLKIFQGILYFLIRTGKYHYSSSPQLKQVNKTFKIFWKIAFGVLLKKVFSDLNRCAHVKLHSLQWLLMNLSNTLSNVFKNKSFLSNTTGHSWTSS